MSPRWSRRTHAASLIVSGAIDSDGLDGSFKGKFPEFGPFNDLLASQGGFPGVPDRSDSPRRVVVAVMIQPAGLGFEPIDLRGAKPPDDKCCYLIMPERLVHVDPAAAARAVWSSRDG